MITPDYARRMARYNLWQNKSIYDAAFSLSDDERRLDRGSFFKSIHATLSHVRWADQIWMHRLGGWEITEASIQESTDLYPDWASLKASREKADHRLLEWADKLTADEINGDLSWYSGAVKADLVRPRSVCIMQVFNHQTHHRGQVHTMLTSAGAKPDDTDLPFLPESYL